jgi:hypothetical protein
MKHKCSHILTDISLVTGLPTYTYCEADASQIVSGVEYCANHAVENDRRERIAGLIEKIDANRPQA